MLAGWLAGWLARATLSWHDDVWLMDSTPVECGRSRTTQQRSDLGGWAEYGYCASHSRYFWGLRLHLVATLSRLPVAFALAGAKADERDTATEMIGHGGIARAGQTLIADKGYRSTSFEEGLNQAHMTLIRPATKTETARAGRRFLRPFRQIIESIFQTFKGQLDLERHGGRTKAGVVARVLQRILALTAVIWHNETTQRPGPARSLIAYDHQNLGTNHACLDGGVVGPWWGWSARSEYLQRIPDSGHSYGVTCFPVSITRRTIGSKNSNGSEP